MHIGRISLIRQEHAKAQVTLISSTREDTIANKVMSLPRSQSCGAEGWGDCILIGYMLSDSCMYCCSLPTSLPLACMATLSLMRPALLWLGWEPTLWKRTSGARFGCRVRPSLMGSSGASRPQSEPHCEPPQATASPQRTLRSRPWSRPGHDIDRYFLRNIYLFMMSSALGKFCFHVENPVLPYLSY